MLVFFFHPGNQVFAYHVYIFPPSCDISNYLDIQYVLSWHKHVCIIYRELAQPTNNMNLENAIINSIIRNVIARIHLVYI